MSIEQAAALIEKMKADVKFRKNIIAIGNPEERIKKWQAAGYDCSTEDIETLMDSLSKTEFKENNLPHTWQCKGPCHILCKDILHQ